MAEPDESDYPAGTDAAALAQASVVFQPKSWDQLALKPIVPPRWVCKNILPVGSMTMVSAFPKVGKSTLVYGMLSAVQAGKDFMGLKSDTGPLNTMILALDGEHESLVLNRLHQFKMPTNGKTWVVIDDEFRANTKAKMSEMEHDIQHLEIQLLVVDTLSKAWDVADENSSQDVIKALAPWRTLRRKHGDLTILMIHHNGKGSAKRGAEGIRGSSAIFAEVDQTVILHKESKRKDDHRRRIETEGRFGSPIEVIVELGDDGEYVNLGSTFEVGQSTRHMIIETIAINAGGMQDLCQRLTMKETTLLRHLKRIPGWILQTDKLPGKGAPKLYDLSDKARELLKDGAEIEDLLEREKGGAA